MQSVSNTTRSVRRSNDVCDLLGLTIFNSNSYDIVEEKYGDDMSDEDDSTSEEEDDAADLATADLDAEIFATLDAIKKKDPRVYDPNSTFYTPFDPDTAPAADDATKKEKPMYLADYQRKKLLEGADGQDDEEDDAPPRTYAQEQQDLKNSLVNQMHAVGDDESDEDADDGFLVKKANGVHTDMPAARTSRKITNVDIESADRDPETFLSNFMAARAWVPDESARFKALESDDSEDDNRADQFEHAYNLRFEDPKTSNEKLMTFSRDVGKYSARRDDVSGRKKQREKEREKKEAVKTQRQEEKARLRKFKIEEVEEKVKKIKEAAGLKGEELDLKAWSQVLEEDWDDDRWEKEMQQRFGDGYYADGDDRAVSEDEDDAEEAKKSKKINKPKWDDDIDIKDILPEFDDAEETVKPEFTLSDVEETAEAAPEEDDDAAMDIDIIDDAEGSGKRKTKKDRLKEKADQKRIARKERMAIEELVDHDLTTDLPSGSSRTSGFRYRETSPDAFGLTPRDILFADDTQLNQFAGLKKMAAFRDEEKKKRDKKKLGKKARLRQWRKDTFGNEDGFTGGFKEFLEEKPAEGQASEGGSRKRRGNKRKAEGMEA